MNRSRRVFHQLSLWWFAAFAGLMGKQLLFSMLIGFGPLRVKTQLLTVLGTSCALIALSSLGGRRWGPRITISISLFVGLILLANLIYIRQFHAPVPLLSSGQTGNLGGLWDSILGLSSPWDLALLADIPLLVFWNRIKGQPPSKIPMSAVGTTLLLALSLHATAAAKEFLVQHRKPFELNFDNLENIVRLSAPMYYAIEAGHLLATERPHNLSPEEMTHMQLWWEHRQAAITAAPLLEHAPAFGSQKGRSLIIIQVEALEETFLGATIANREITPHLNRLAGFELRLSNFRSQVAHGNTADAELAVLTGWHPLPKGAAFFRYPAARHSSLPERLAKHGYASLAYHGNRASFWNRGLVYKTLGFDGFLAKGSLPDGEIIGMGLNDATLLDAMFTDLQAARERRQKLFSFGITLSSHTPFEISPDKVEPEFNAVLPEGMVGNYMRSLHYADNALGQFIERLKTTGIWDDTVVLIYGDHEGIPAHLRNESLPHSIRAAALGNDRRVPAILHLPGTSPTTIDHLVGQIDLMPTILHLLGIPDSTGSKPPVSFGVNAFKRLPRSLVFAAEGRVVRESDGPTEEATREELILSERLLETCNQRPTCGELP